MLKNSFAREVVKRAKKIPSEAKQFGKDFMNTLSDFVPWSYAQRQDIKNKYEYENQDMYRKHIKRELKKAGAPEDFINKKTSQSEVEKALSGKNNKLR